MTRKTIPLRTRFYLALEGAGEQGFVIWLQNLANEKGLNIHLDYDVIGGGGYQSMLKKAELYSKRKNSSKGKAVVFLIVDADRADRDDGWTLAKLREEAAKKNINLCIQSPNQEGLLLRMWPGNEQLRPTSADVLRKLLRVWPEYDKPIDARALSSKFKLSDLHRVAQIDSELRVLLTTVGLL